MAFLSRPDASTTFSFSCSCSSFYAHLPHFEITSFVGSNFTWLRVVNLASADNSWIEPKCLTLLQIQTESRVNFISSLSLCSVPPHKNFCQRHSSAKATVRCRERNESMNLPNSIMVFLQSREAILWHLSSLRFVLFISCFSSMLALQCQRRWWVYEWEEDHVCLLEVKHLTCRGKNLARTAFLYSNCYFHIFTFTYRQIWPNFVRDNRNVYDY